MSLMIQGERHRFYHRKDEIEMDFSAWSPSHTTLVFFAVAVFIGQVAVYFYRTKQNDKKLDKQGEDFRLVLKEQGEIFFHAIERLAERMDKRFVEVNQQIGEVRQEISGVRSEMNQRLSDITTEISKMNQNHIDHLTRHES